LAISKRLRYEILRRDNHTCRYCGKAAPETELTIDHVTPKALGGTDDPTNLVAACKDCNAGKSSSGPGQSLVADVSADALRWARAIAEASEALLQDHDRRHDLREQFRLAWCSWTYPSNGQRVSFDLPNNWANSVDRILSAGLPVEVLCECVDLTFGIKFVRDPFAYLCGIAWRKVAELREIATALIEADEPKGKHHRASDGQPV
jgi:hypothetical protein